jgi:hypothetical protein
MEARMRLGLFMDLVESGKSADDAAELVGNALLNYGLMKGNATYRTTRDVIPFFAFTAQTIPQQADFLRRYPAVAVGLAQLYGSSPNEEPLMPWIADQPSFKVGEDKEGLGQYVTSLGLPVEALSMIPNPSGGLREFGRDVERSVIGSANPLLKTAYGLTTGREPYFGTKYGSYAKTPYIAQALGAPESSETARLYHQLVGTGLLQMIKTPENMLSRVADPRMNSLEKALSLLSGVRIASNDPDRAAMLMLQEQLQFDPQAKTYTTYYGGSVSTEKMIKLLRKYQDRVKEKREAKEAAGVQQ